jgi:hypothetical protein
MHNKRQVEKEQFFTQDKTAERLGLWLKQQPWFAEVDEIIEPSAGDGVWLDQFDTITGYDLDPKNPAIIKQDFLDLWLPNNNKRLFVGNPPYGKRAGLAKKFMNKCAELGCSHVAFILPASLGKLSVSRGVHKNLHLIHQEELFDEKFRRDGKLEKVTSIFQVWEWREDKRVDKVEPVKHKDFSFVSPCDADFCLRTHGYSSGTIIEKDFQQVSKNIALFVEEHTNGVLEKFKRIDWSQVNKFSTAQPSFGKADVIRLYNSLQ